MVFFFYRATGTPVLESVYIANWFLTRAALLKPVKGLFENIDIPEQNQFNILTENYEGPIDLLLDLAKKQKVDLSEISITELAEQYVTFIQNYNKIHIEIAADYLVMAAWLTYLKSRLLLPKKINSDEPSAEETIEILRGVSGKYEEHHELEITDEALRAAATMALPTVSSSNPRDMFVLAADCFTNPRALMKGLGKPRPLIGKFNTARIVDAPKRASIGTSISPMESRSILVLWGVDILVPS